MNDLLSTARSLRPLVEAEADATDRELTMTTPVVEALADHARKAITGLWSEGAESVERSRPPGSHCPADGCAARNAWFPPFAQSEATGEMVHPDHLAESSDAFT